MCLLKVTHILTKSYMFSHVEFPFLILYSQENPFQEAERLAEERRRQRRRRRASSRNIECGPEGYQRLAESTDEDDEEDQEEEVEEGAGAKTEQNIGKLEFIIIIIFFCSSSLDFLRLNQWVLYYSIFRIYFCDIVLVTGIRLSNSFRVVLDRICKYTGRICQVLVASCAKRVRG